MTARVKTVPSWGGRCFAFVGGGGGGGGGHDSPKSTQTSFIPELGIWVYLKGYDLENSKRTLLRHSDDPLPWKQFKMVAKQIN